MNQNKITKPRDYSIDFFKGITVISILLIHTVWWSGSDYVPNFARQLSLLIDVPLFFFLSGCSATFSFKKATPFSGVVRLVSLFSLAYFFYALFLHSEYLFDFTISALLLNYLETPEIIVFSNSTWFIPVFVVIYVVGFIIVKHVARNNILLLICFLLLLLIFRYDNIEIISSFKFFSFTVDLYFTYLFFFLFGYYIKAKLTQKQYLIWGSIILVCSLLTTIVFFWDIPFDLQDYKFPARGEYAVASMISVSFFLLGARWIKKEYRINFIGKNALSFYLAQGLGSSFLYSISPYFQLDWQLKLPLMFLINLILSTVIALLVIRVFNIYTKVGNRIIQQIDNL